MADTSSNSETSDAGIMSSKPATSSWIVIVFLWLTLGSIGILTFLAGKWDELPNLRGVPEKFSESMALMTIAMLGALGGTLHAIQSFVVYVGDRKLLRSWVPYYFFAPIKGAILAVVLVLVLRWGVVSQSGNATAANLNWLGLYSIAAMAGMFSNQAIEKLADIFNNVLKQVVADNPRKPDPK